MEPNSKESRIEELNAQYKQACLDGTKAGLNTMVNNFIDNESITSDYKQKIINMIVSLLTRKEH